MVKIPHVQIYLRKLFSIIFVNIFKKSCFLFGSCEKRFYLCSVKQ